MNNLEKANNFQQYGIEIISPADTNFDVELIRYIGNYSEVIPLVESAKPLVLFIRNNSPKEIIGVSLRWKFVKSNGETIFHQTSESTPGVLMGMQPLDPWMVGKTSLINDNEIKFFSYFFVGQIINNTNLRVKYPDVKYGHNISSEEIQQMLSHLESQKNSMLNDVSNASVSIDGMFFNDGIFIGENQNLYFELMNGQIQARRDFLKRLKDSKSLNKSDSEILTQFLFDTRQMTLPVGGRFINGKDAFEQSYKGALRNLNKEIEQRRNRFADSAIVDDYLKVQDSDFVDIQRS